MFKRLRSWRFALAMSAGLWIVVLVIIWFTFDNDAPGGTRPGWGWWALNRAGLVVLLAAWLTLLAAAFGMVRSLMTRRGKRPRI